jgi:hypothetical protein
MNEWPFKVIDDYGESHGRFATLEAARDYIKMATQYSIGNDTYLDQFFVWQFVEEHNKPEVEQ